MAEIPVPNEFKEILPSEEIFDDKFKGARRKFNEKIETLNGLEDANKTERIINYM